MNLVNSHYVKPSFNGQTITMKVGDKITLTDTNNVLSNYDVIMSNNAEYQVNGNTITIRATNVGNITMQFKKKCTLQDNILFIMAMAFKQCYLLEQLIQFMHL